MDDNIKRTPRLGQFNTVPGDRYGLSFCMAGAGRKSPQRVEREQPQLRSFDFYGLCHLYGGRGVHWTEETGWQDVYPGAVILSMPGSVHVYGAAAGEYWQEDAIAFYGPRVDKLCHDGLLPERGSLLLPDFFSSRRLEPIIRTAISQTYASQLRAAVMVEQLLVEIHLHLQAPSAGEGRDLALEELIYEIETHPEAEWRVGEMAARLHLSPSHFRRVFRDRVGMGPKAFCESTRLARASLMLSSTNLPIGELAGKVGYLDSFHFSKRFRHHYGVSPRSYRQRASGMMGSS